MRHFLRSLFWRNTATQKIDKTMNNTRRTMSSTGSISAALYACTFSAPTYGTSVPDDVTSKPHHNKNGKGFINPWESWKDMSAFTIAKFVLSTHKQPDTTPPTVPVITPTFLSNRTSSSSLRATWLGHACYYVEFPNGLRVLFDPVFEDRCSPFSFMGPKRYTPSPIKQISEIPIIDVVVISHSHYDHLSHPTVLEIKKKHPDALFAVGLGLKKWFNDCGIENVVEMDWWQDMEIVLEEKKGGKRISTTSSIASVDKTNDKITAKISCLPCQHTSARTAFDKGHTLWASWAVEAGGKSVWFGGDTGYRAVPQLPDDVDDWSAEYASLPRCPAFKQIGDLRGPFDLGLIPIGAYDPRWIMSPMHANPYDSVEIFKDTKCKQAMGIHWGTWVLTWEDVLEPPALLKKALTKSGIPEVGTFDVCDIGESREF